jgi:hypothetical protein
VAKGSNARVGRAFATIACIACVALASACGSTSDQPSGAPIDEGLKRPTSETGLSSISPLDELAGVGTGPRSRVAYQRAIESSIAQCMASRGWTYVPVARDQAGVQPIEPAAAIEWANTYGYGLLNVFLADPTGTRKQAYEENTRYFDALSESERTRFLADLSDKSGCAPESHAVLDSRFAFNDQQLLEEIRVARQETLAGKHLAEEVQAWRECMGRAGIAATSLESGRALFNEQVESGTFGEVDLAREREVATTDARCLAEFVWPAQAQHEQSVVEELVARYGSERTCGLGC